MVVPLPDQAVNRVQLFGKLPAHGDFIVRGLVAAERDAIDTWIAASMSAARDRMGDDLFAERFDIAPPWRCVVPIEQGVLAGALAPSVDAVGRRYPIYLACTQVDVGADAYAEACEGLLYEALAESWDADTLNSAAEAIEVESVDVAGGAARWWTLGNDQFDPDTLPGAQPVNLFEVLLRREGEGA